MTAPINILKNVQTFQKSSLALLQNMGPFCSPDIMNMMFRNFNEDYLSNLGDTITFNRPVRYSTQSGLVVTNFQSTQQLFETLVVDQSANIAFAFNARDLIFNVDTFLDGFGRSAVGELSTTIQSDVASEIEKSTYRYYGDTTGGAVINSYGQLAKALAKYANFGAPTDVKRKVILPDTAVPDIINNGLQQFAINRNNQDANTWQIASTMNADFYMSNLLPNHYSGTVGEEAIELTVTAVSLDGTQITMTGANVSDADSIKANDILVFDYDNATTGINALFFQTYIGHLPSQQKPQGRAVTNVGSDGAGEVVVTVNPAMIYDPTNTNANRNLTATLIGVKVRVLPSHKCGVIISGNPFYLAMPALPEKLPYYTANQYDSVNGTSIRLVYGSQYEGDTYGFIYDAIWGKKLVADYAMRLIFPLDGGF